MLNIYAQGIVERSQYCEVELEIVCSPEHYSDVVGTMMAHGRFNPNNTASEDLYVNTFSYNLRGMEKWGWDLTLHSRPKHELLWYQFRVRIVAKNEAVQELRDFFYSLA